MIVSVQHDRKADTDYNLVCNFGFRSVRDAVRWHLVDQGDYFDFSSLLALADAAQKYELQVVWDLLHYGWPDDLDIFSGAFVDRFATFAGAVARFFADRSDAIPFYSPINEISFMAWAATRGLMYPFARGRDSELKRQLVRAAIAACEAIWAVDRRARLVFPEPTVHCVPLRTKPDWTKPAEEQNESQYEAWDMIAGYKNKELGGDPKYLDILGSNFYHSNQWECPDGDRLHWHVKPRDARWVPLHVLLGRIYGRYGRPLLIAETSHVGVGRAEWILEIAREVQQAREEGIPIEAICLYPILDRTDWDDPGHWHNSGLWDLRLTDDGQYERILNEPYSKGLKAAGDILGQPIGGKN